MFLCYNSGNVKVLVLEAERDFISSVKVHGSTDRLTPLTSVEMLRHVY